MKFITYETIVLGMRNLLLHKLRSLLTVLGIIFGVGAVICMLSVSEGASADELRAIQLLGTQNIIVNSIQPKQTNQASQGSTTLSQYGIKRDDVALVNSTIPHVVHVTSLKTVSYEIRRGASKSSALVVGTEPAFLRTVNIDVAVGRALTTEDMENSSAICVIGDELKRELFTYEDPIGATILVRRDPSSVPFTVVGVLQNVQTAGAPERGVEERDLNREAFIPLTTANKLFGEITVRRGSGTRELTKIEVSGLYVTVDELENVLPVSEMVKRVFEHNHANEDYEIRVPLAKLKIAEKKARNSKIVLGLIAGISLLVGGIGIMNIMLATVTERTREIGIRRALGAKRGHIISQFLIETVVLSTGGGLVGVLLGCVGAAIISWWANWTTIVQIWAIFLSFGLSVIVGIFFGMYPALTAARLDPIEALRHE